MLNDPEQLRDWLALCLTVMRDGLNVGQFVSWCISHGIEPMALLNAEPDHEEDEEGRPVMAILADYIVGEIMAGRGMPTEVEIAPESPDT